MAVIQDFNDLNIFPIKLSVYLKIRDSCPTKWLDRFSQEGICTSVSGLLRCGTWDKPVVRTFEIIRNHQEPHAMVILESFMSSLRLA